MAEEYKISLGVDINEQSLNSIKTQINGIESKIDPIKVKLDTSDITKQINNIKSQIQSLSDIKINFGTGTGLTSGSSNGVNATQNTANQLKKSYRELLTMANQISNLEAKVGKLKFTGNNINQIEVLESKLKSLKTTYDGLANSFVGKNALTSGVFDVGDIDKLNNAVSQGKQKLNELEAEYEDTRVKLAKKLEINLQEGKFSAQVAKVNSDAKKLSSTSTELKAKLTELETAEQSMNTAFKNGDVEQKIAAYKKYEIALESVKNQLVENKIVEQQTNSSDSLTIAKENAMLRLKNLFGENSEAARMFASEVDRLQKEINECGSLSGMPNLNKQITNLGLKVKEADVQTKTFSQTLKEQWQHYKSYLSIASVFMYTTQALRSMFEQVKLIDSAMTELKKVTDETDATYNKFLTNAASRAKELGTTVDGLISSTADFARLGYGFEDAQGLAEVANIYAVVGDEIDGVEQATESLISTMAAFKDEMGSMSNSDFALSIVDKFNEVSNNFSISSGGIGEALERSASSLATANNTLDESISLITAANVVVQDEEKVGKQAMPTIKMAISVKLLLEGQDRAKAL